MLPEGRIGKPASFILNFPGLAKELKRVNIRNLQDLELRKIGNKKVLDPLFFSFPIKENSDFYPILDLNAARTMFLNKDARDFVKLGQAPIPVFDMLEGSTPQWEKTFTSASPTFSKSKQSVAAMAFRDYFLKSDPGLKDQNPSNPILG